MPSGRNPFCRFNPPVAFTCFAVACGLISVAPRATLGDTDAAAEGHGFGMVEELILGESPFPQDRGEIQVTASAEHLSSEEENTTDLVLELEYGITDRFQIGTELPYGLIDGKDGEPDEDGVKDMAVSAMWNFLREDNMILSVMGEAAFTNGDEDKELGEEDAEFEAMLLGSVRVGGAELYGGVGVEFTDDDEAFVYSAGVAAPLGPVVGLLEVAGSDGTDGEEDEAYIAPGLAVEIIDDVQAILGVPIGLNDHAADWGVTFRIAMEF